MISDSLFIGFMGMDIIEEVFYNASNNNDDDNIGTKNSILLSPNIR